MNDIELSPALPSSSLPETPAAEESVWVLDLPVNKVKDDAGNTRKSIDPNNFLLAANRIEMFVELHKLPNVNGVKTLTGFSLTLPDTLATELVSFVRISGARLSKMSPNRKQRRAAGV
jgi:hypothetical protein